MDFKKTILSLYASLPPQLQQFRSNYRRVHAFYNDAQWWTKDEIEAWQLSRIKSVIKYAYDNTPGYRHLYDEAGVIIDDIHSLEDITYLPFTNKDLLRSNIKEFTVSSSISGHLSRSTTGGSSGIPFSFYYDFRNSGAEKAFINSAWESFGWKQSDIGIRLRGSYVGNNDKLFKKTGFHRFEMSSVFLTDDNYERYIQGIENTKASFLHVYPSTITDLSHLIITHHDEGRLKIKHLLLASENLYLWQENIIRKAFPNSQLISFYGHTERAILAPWCEKEEKYHINPFYGYTEILNANNQNVHEGEIGELVGTSFWMFGTPFIRYRTCDFAEKGPDKCEKCGRNFQILNSIDGRLAEIIIGKTGRRISLTVFAGSVMHGKLFDHIRQFRFVQKEKGILTLKVIPEAEFDENDMRELRRGLNDFLSDDFVYYIEIVDELERTRRGKFTYLEQHLSVDRSDYGDY
jgi:phenylacetate-CoA ligase